jgi:hypothetical protein
MTTALQGQESLFLKTSFPRCTAIAGLLCLSVAGAIPAASAMPANPQYGPDHGGWNAPDQDPQHRGFRDGQNAAQQDIANHQRPDPNHRQEFRHPPLPPELHGAYRDGFLRGYQQAASHMPGGQPPVPPSPPAPRSGDGFQNNGPALQIRHHGFQDGMDGALHDMDNNRRPDPNNRDEFRHPAVPPELAEPYRDGFRHGYNAAVQALTAMPNSWRMGPFGTAHSRGFHDGAEGALRDYENQRRPDPNNRDEYRHPAMPPDLAEPYRDGFQHGYARVTDELQGYFGRF